MTKNLLTQQRGESLEAFITRVRNMSAEERLNAAEQQRTAVLEGYQKASKPSSYKRKVYHK